MLIRKYTPRSPVRPRTTRDSQAGFTLVELMIGILVGMIVVAGVIALYISVIQGSTYATQEARLTQETRISMDFMADDIRRAGYSHAGRLLQRDDGPDVNPFMQDAHNIAIHDGGQCILLAYDPTFSYDLADPNFTFDHDLADLQGQNVQYVFGYRLDGNQLQMLTSQVLDTQDCTLGQWEPLTDPNTTNVTALTFDTDLSRCMEMQADGTVNYADSCADLLPLAPGSVLAESRRVTITLAAEHARDNATRVEYADTASVRNLRIFD